LHELDERVWTAVVNNSHGLLTIPEAAAVLGVTRAAIYTAVRQKRLPGKLYRRRSGGPSILKVRISHLRAFAEANGYDIKVLPSL
jgi:excisionase family DNA binding protein